MANIRMPLSKFDDYYASVSSLKKKYENRVSIKTGLECEYSPEYIGWLEQFLIDKKLGYIVFGNHYFKTDEERVYFRITCEEEAWLIAYMSEVAAGTKTNLCSHLCHPDLFMQGRHMFDEIAKRESIRLCRAAKELYIPLGYNPADVAYNDIMHTMQYPHIGFWKTAAEVGSTTIIGVNIHEPAALETDSYHEEGIVLLSGLGVKITDTLSLRGFIGYE